MYYTIMLFSVYPSLSLFILCCSFLCTRWFLYLSKSLARVPFLGHWNENLERQISLLVALQLFSLTPKFYVHQPCRKCLAQVRFVTAWFLYWWRHHCPTRISRTVRVPRDVSCPCSVGLHLPWLVKQQESVKEKPLKSLIEPAVADRDMTGDYCRGDFSLTDPQGNAIV